MLITLLGTDGERSDTIGSTVGGPNQAGGYGLLSVTSGVGGHKREDHDKGCGEDRS